MSEATEWLRKMQHGSGIRPMMRIGRAGVTTRVIAAAHGCPKMHLGPKTWRKIIMLLRLMVEEADTK